MWDAFVALDIRWKFAIGVGVLAVFLAIVWLAVGSVGGHGGGNACCKKSGAPCAFDGMCPDGDVGLVTADPEAEWQVHHTSIKPWPSCRP